MSEEMSAITEKQRISWCYSFESSKRWLTTVKVEGIGSKHTEREYSRAIYTFCKWTGINPDQLIEEAKEDLQKTEDRIKQFCVWLEDNRSITRTTIATKYFAPLKSFYEHNKLRLDLKTPKHTSIPIKPHTTEEITALMEIAGLRERAIITILKDSGLSRQDVVKLTYGDVKKEIEADNEFIVVNTIRQKVLIRHHTFLGRNAVKYLKAYLKFRENRGEKITKDSPLIVTVSGQALTPVSLSIIFDRLGKKVGFKTSPHRLRKYFESHVGLSVPSLLLKYWMGHSLGVESSYFIPPVEKQREKYMEAYREIDIFRTEISEMERKKLHYKNVVDFIFAKDPAKLRQAYRLIDEAETTEDLMKIPQTFSTGFALDVIIGSPEDADNKKSSKSTEDKDCSRIIDETELAQWLGKGWHFVATLPSGKILVSNEI